MNMIDGIYDDGEWISWDYINHQLYIQDLKKEYPAADIKIVQIFEDLVLSAKEYWEQTSRYLQIWGELGELYAEIKYGLERHKPNAPGSDGRIGNDWIEVKTISPEKSDEKIQIKRAGNFNKILMIKIDEDFNFESKLISRKELKKGTGKFAQHSWNNEDSSG
tara:strand:+ start:528 stop:1016 length:489 start_codon:yes stop_codon:yes gene_type:complete